MKRNNKIAAILILSALTILSLCIFSFAGPPNPPPPPPSISGTPSPTATVGTSYGFTPSSANVTSFSCSGTLPPGLTFSAVNGSVSGIPTSAGTFGGIVITASNSVGSLPLSPFSILVASSGGTGGTGSPVPVMDGWWLFAGMLAGIGLLARRRKDNN